MPFCYNIKSLIEIRYCWICNISGTIVGNKIVEHSDVVGALPVGAAPATSSFSTYHLASMDWGKTTARAVEKHWSLGAPYFRGLMIIVQLYPLYLKMLTTTCAPFQYKDCLSRYVDLQYNDKAIVRPSYLIMEIPILVRQHLHIEVASCLWLIWF